MAGVQDLMPQEPGEGPPLPRFLGIKWPKRNSGVTGARFEGRYSDLPTSCVCRTPGCGYRVDNPKAHCYELTCPNCGAKLWREK